MLTALQASRHVLLTPISSSKRNLLRTRLLSGSRNAISTTPSPTAGSACNSGNITRSTAMATGDDAPAACSAEVVVVDVVVVVVVVVEAAAADADADDITAISSQEQNQSVNEVSEWIRHRVRSASPPKLLKVRRSCVSRSHANFSELESGSDCASWSQ